MAPAKSRRRRRLAIRSAAGAVQGAVAGPSPQLEHLGAQEAVDRRQGRRRAVGRRGAGRSRGGRTPPGAGPAAPPDRGGVGQDARRAARRRPGARRRGTGRPRGRPPRRRRRRRRRPAGGGRRAPRARRPGAAPGTSSLVRPRAPSGVGHAAILCTVARAPPDLDRRPVATARVPRLGGASWSHACHGRDRVRRAPTSCSSSTCRAPRPLPTEVLVRVVAAGVNPVDWKTRPGPGDGGRARRARRSWWAGTSPASSRPSATASPRSRRATRCSACPGSPARPAPTPST